MTAIAVSGLNAGDFSVSGSNCLATPVAAGASCAIPVTFAPLASGIRTTTLTITDDAANSPQMVTAERHRRARGHDRCSCRSHIERFRERGPDGTVQPASHAGRGFQRHAGLRVFGNANGNELQRAQCDRDKRRNREFHGVRDDQRQRARRLRRATKFPGVPPFYAVRDDAATAFVGLVLLAHAPRTRRNLTYTFDWKRVVAIACLAFLMNGCGGGAEGEEPRALRNNHRRSSLPQERTL